MTNYERIKIMSKEGLAMLLTRFAQKGTDETIDAVCEACKRHHQGDCLFEKTDLCCYPYDYETIAAWLDLED